MFEVLEHIVNTDHVLEELYRVLKPQGVLIISTPNLASWINRLLILLDMSPYNYNVSFKYPIHGPKCNLAPYGHIRLYTPKLLAKHLKAVGFQRVEIKGLLTSYGASNALTRSISTLLSALLSAIRPHLAPDILAIAIKI
ncbi:MAG: methyltransferase domain-containing protein [Infirmifilum sp.]